jgi:hypothetical protein
MSMIHDPAAQKTILLDHVKREAKIMPAIPQAPQPGMPAIPGMPAMPAFPGAPQPPAVHVQDLGKSVLQGQPVDGKRYLVQPPPPPAMPQLPGMPKPPHAAGVPGLPQIPGMPKPPAAPGMPPMPAAPGMPQAPKPPAPVIAEVWTSSHLQLPMATRINGSFGQQTTMCQRAIPGEPHPAVFAIPPDYKQVLPAPPKPPGIPKPPALPKMPGM